MAPSKLRQALGAVKDQTSIGLAKVGSGGSLESDLDVAIVKATRHSESFPASERHIREILTLTCLSRVYVASCVASLSRRLGRTRSWAVALKTLVIVHRLLADGDPAFEHELFHATRRGTRLLNMSDFCDRSPGPDAADFSAFVRSYAAYLDHRLEFRMLRHQQAAGPTTPAAPPAAGARSLQDTMYYYAASPGNHRYACDVAVFNGTHDSDAAAAADAEVDAEADNDHHRRRRAVALVARGEGEPSVGEMTAEELLGKAGQLQALLDRFVACRPVGAAARGANRVVAVALYPLVKESVQLYCELTAAAAALVDRFADLETEDCERARGLLCGLAAQMEELRGFYAWCKVACVCRESDVPEVVEVVSQRKLELMDEFIRDRHERPEQEPETTVVESTAEPAPFEEEEDMNATRALPAPPEEPAEAPHVEQVEEPEAAPLVVADEPVEEEADFLNLKADAMTGEEHGQKLALALFDGDPAAAGGSSAPTFQGTSADWETELVQSASALASQRAELGGGLSMLVLDGMYSHGAAAAAANGAQTFSGSASSVASRPPASAAPVLALPAPPGPVGGSGAADPFAASALVPPPTYVQMSDMQTKQQLLTQEQLMWQQYGNNGMRPGGLPTVEQRPNQNQHILPHNYSGYRTS